MHNIKILNFYLPQTITYFIGPIVIFCFQVVLIIGILVAILMVIFKNNKFKSYSLKIYSFIIFSVYLLSIYITYLVCSPSNKPFPLVAIITFFLFFGLIFLIYYVPLLAIFFTDFLISFIKNKVRRVGKR